MTGFRGIVIKIVLENSAFKENEEEEIKRVLSTIEPNGCGGNILDSNGNWCGTYRFSNFTY